jgi:hypothetical protein
MFYINLIEKYVEQDYRVPSDPPRTSYNRWLAVLVALFLTSTIIFTILFAVEKNKVTTATSTIPTMITTTATTTVPTIITTTTTGSTPTTSSSGIVIHHFT